ncbi:MAG: class I SAM-dependent methyltransferase [Deltaproteobacteria bacterium]|nr:class I SAM-dependent methyltransferase [Deltaproteobacteria bacterium]
MRRALKRSSLWIIGRVRGPKKEKKKSRFNYADLIANKMLTAKLCNFGKKFINSDYKPDDHLVNFVKEIKDNDVAVSLGSGNKRLKKGIINVDIENFENVDVVADIRKLPFEDGFADCIIAEAVLEHVAEPHKCIDEAYRVLKPGGKMIATVPLIHIYHAYPKHYFNFTKDS